MADYRSRFDNGNDPRDAVREAEKRVDKIVNGTVTTKPKTAGNKLKSMFFADDLDNMKDYILEDLVIPTMKNTFLDIVSTILGNGGVTNRRPVPGAKVSYPYRKHYDDARRDPIEARHRDTYDYDDVIFDDRGDAERVLYCMEEVLATEDFVRVGDYYDFAEQRGNYTNYNYGWSDLYGSRVVRTYDGRYTIKLPRPVPYNSMQRR